ncbi:MAG: hypothetical protein KFH87_05165 [Bacteroidetes bacterium]|nr:hypothetical protein [Bacteroidota bacterium]
MMKATLIFGVFFALFGSAMATTTWTVTTNRDSGPQSLRSILERAGDGDRVVFALRAGEENISLTSALSVEGKSIHIDGRNRNMDAKRIVTLQVRIPGQSPYRVFHLNPGHERTVRLEHLILRGGDVSGVADNAFGGVVFLERDGNLQLTGCTVRDGRAREGGGIYAGGRFHRGRLTLRECDIFGNEAVAEGGIAAGGGVYVSFGWTVIHSTLIYENAARSHSGGIVIFNAGGTISNSAIVGNTLLSGASSEGSFTGPLLNFVRSRFRGEKIVASVHTRNHVVLPRVDMGMISSGRKERLHTPFPLAARVHAGITAVVDTP